MIMNYSSNHDHGDHGVSFCPVKHFSSVLKSDRGCSYLLLLIHLTLGHCLPCLFYGEIRLASKQSSVRKLSPKLSL